tara:strand:+ start:1670 stop:1861 length:192 start_codon:yes stop_codon:yes gene_type:complete
MEPPNRAMVEKITNETSINKAPKTRNCKLMDNFSVNKNPGNSAKKKRVTLGFSTFIINPILNN